MSKINSKNLKNKNIKIFLAHLMNFVKKLNFLDRIFSSTSKRSV